MTAWFDPTKAATGATQLELPFGGALPARSPQDQRRARGQVAYLSGLAAEDSVLRRYVMAGYAHLASRWRGQRAEIDLILRKDDTFVFVEVKKSRSFDAALLSLGHAQRQRIMMAAAGFLDSIAVAGLADMRFDLALVDATGQMQIMENAFFEGE